MSISLVLQRNMVREAKDSFSSPGNNTVRPNSSVEKEHQFSNNKLEIRTAFHVWPPRLSLPMGEMEPESKPPKDGIRCILSLIHHLFCGGKHDSIFKVFQKFAPSLDAQVPAFFSTTFFIWVLSFHDSVGLKV